VNDWNVYVPGMVWWFWSFGDGFIGKIKTLSRGFRGGIMIFF
jgi:hypothetical protein